MISTRRCWTGRYWIEFGRILAIGFGPDRFVERIVYREAFPSGFKPNLQDITDTVIKHRYDRQKAGGYTDEEIARQINDELNDILSSELGLSEGRIVGRRTRRTKWLYCWQHGANAAAKLNKRAANASQD